MMPRGISGEKWVISNQGEMGWSPLTAPQQDVLRIVGRSGTLGHRPDASLALITPLLPAGGGCHRTGPGRVDSGGEM